MSPEPGCVIHAQISEEDSDTGQGAVEIEPEKRMHMHNRLDLADLVVAFVKDRHPYDVPNVTAIPLVGGNTDYFAWIEAETLNGDAAVDAG